MDCHADEKECPHAEESAKRAVKMVFAILGVNVDEPKEVEEFRENLRFGASLRRAADRGWMAAVGIIATAAMATIWIGIQTLLGNHK